MRRVALVAAGIVTVLAPWYGQPAVVRLSAWIVVLVTAAVLLFPLCPRLPLGGVAVAISTGASAWAWQCLQYNFVDAEADSGKVLLWTTIEVGALTVLSVALTRDSVRAARFTGGLLVLPGAAVGLRLLPRAGAWEQLFLSCLGAATVLGGVLLGHYLRGLDRARVAAVERARADQRRALAVDLHDYVAHDIAGIAVLAQSARIVGGDDGGHSMEQIERAATRALQRLDHSIQLMREHATRAMAEYGLTDVPDLVAAYPFPVELTMEVGESDDISASVQATAHRVISEALTNVSRHARPGAPVRVSATRAAGRLEITVSNDRGNGAVQTRGAPSGSGLAQLQARVAALQGRMSAGATGGSWQVQVSLPLH